MYVFCGLVAFHRVDKSAVDRDDRGEESFSGSSINVGLFFLAFLMCCIDLRISI